MTGREVSAVPVPIPPRTSLVAASGRRPRRRPGVQSEPGGVLQKALALFVIVLLGARINLASGINLTAGLVVGIVLTPLWTSVVTGFRSARTIMVGGSVSLVVGAVLTYVNAADHQRSVRLMIGNSVLVLTLLVGVGVLLWARTLFQPGVIAIAFGVGLLLVIAPSEGLFSTNPWKFGFSVPVTVIVLGMAARFHSRIMELGAMVVLLLVSVLNDARSSAAILLLAAMMVVWQMVPRPTSKKGSTVLILATVGLLAVVVYNVGESLILNGALGEETQQRSQAQVDASGSLILGGRPEIAATLSLFENNPMGFGSGTKPSHVDLNTAKAGMAAINYDPNNGYVERYMFGTGYEVHSVIGDLWAAFGWAGLLYTLTLLGMTVKGLAETIAAYQASALAAFLAVKLLWNIPFSPFYSSLPLMILLFGVALPAVTRAPVGALNRLRRPSM